MDNNNDTQNHLPEELLFYEIFLCLPIKSLLICKCVCKKWNSIISNPEFASLHLKKSPFSNDQSLLINTKTGFLSFDLENFGVEVITETTTDDHHHLNVSVVASCNGLVCLDDEATNSLYIWNPITSKKIRIPYPQPLVTTQVVWGLGYVSSTEDYKLIRIYNENFDQKVQIFSFHNNTWKILDVEYEMCSFEELPPINGSGVSVNGMIYWATYYTEYDVGFYDHCFNILGFDVMKEKFMPLTPVPEWSDRGFEQNSVLFLSNGRLCACWRTDEGDIDIGMLREEEAGKQSWVKHFHFDHGSLLYDRKISFQKIQGVTKAGKYAVHVDGEHIILADSNQDSSKKVQLKIPRTKNVIGYVKSLLSPSNMVSYKN